MTPILQREDGGMEELRGEEAGMKAELAKQRKGGRRGKEGERGAAEQSSRDPDRNKKENENRFSFFWQQGKNLFMFLYNEQNYLKKKGQGECKFKKTANGGRINAGLENGTYSLWTTEGERQDTRETKGFQTDKVLMYSVHSTPPYRSIAGGGDKSIRFVLKVMVVEALAIGFIHYNTYNINSGCSFQICKVKPMQKCIKLHSFKWPAGATLLIANTSLIVCKFMRKCPYFSNMV